MYTGDNNNHWWLLYLCSFIWIFKWRGKRINLPRSWLTKGRHNIRSGRFYCILPLFLHENNRIHHTTHNIMDGNRRKRKIKMLSAHPKHTGHSSPVSLSNVPVFELKVWITQYHHKKWTGYSTSSRGLRIKSEQKDNTIKLPRRIFTSNFSKMLGIILLNRTTRASQLNVNQVSHMCCQREKLLRSSQRAVDLRFRSISSGSLSSSCFCEVLRSCGADASRVRLAELK